MDVRLKCLEEIKSLQKKIDDTHCKHLSPQLERVYASYTRVLSMIDNELFVPKLKNMPKRVSMGGKRKTKK